MKPAIDQNGFDEQPALTRQNLSFWMLTQQRRRRKRTPNPHRVILPSPDLEFGDVLAGDTGTQSFHMINKTTRTVTVSAINITSDNALWSSNVSLPLAIAANASANLDLKFSPVAAGKQTAVFNLVTTAGTFSIPATGAGI